MSNCGAGNYFEAYMSKMVDTKSLKATVIAISCPSRCRWWTKYEILMSRDTCDCLSTKEKMHISKSVATGTIRCCQFSDFVARDQRLE
jgi:hypothetical protein